MQLDVTYSVSEFIWKVKNNLENEFKLVNICGELSNYKKASSGHYYFSLVDEDSMVNMCLFRMDAAKNPSAYKLKDGDSVECVGSVSVYNKRGTFQIIVRKIKKIGAGDLKERFEKLKLKLSKKNYFDVSLKKEIPRYPKRIGVVTSPTGAAVKDFLNILKRRSLWFDVLVSPATVQGENGAKSIVKAIKKLEKVEGIDLIILTRGGGSLEDLWNFNEEIVADAIFNCKIPIISAVGHEVDYTISDYCADLRCETPSAAAEVITEHQMALKEKLNLSKDRLITRIDLSIIKNKSRVENLNPKIPLQKMIVSFKNLQARFQKLQVLLRGKELLRISEFQYLLDEMLFKMKSGIDKKLKDNKYRVETNYKQLGSLDPKSILNRGYTFVTDESGKVIGKKKDLDSNSRNININFVDGKQTVAVNEST